MNQAAESLGGINKDKDTLSVSFYEDLIAVDPMDMSHKSYCPECKMGMLLMERDTKGQLKASDRCTLCMQQVQYIDIELVRSTRP